MFPHPTPPHPTPNPREQPEAALPPPFPTSKPRRVYVSNIAVLPQHRRQGVGTLLLRTCERQARLWRQDSLWLHVELKNADALRVRTRRGWGEGRCVFRMATPRQSGLRLALAEGRSCLSQWPNFI